MTATEGFMKAQIEQLEKENKSLKIEIGGLMGERDGLKMVVERLQREKANLEYEIECGYKNRAIRDREYKKLEKENKKLKAELEKYKNDIIYEEGLYD